MGVLQRTDFSGGWQPDADAIGGPVNCLLRADNTTLDELGVVALRKGATPINAVPHADLDVHSLYTAVLDGLRVRFAGVGSYIYRDGIKQTAVLAGSGDVQFGATQGHCFWARSSSKGSFDGTTVRQWGIPMSAIGPSAQPADDGERVSLAECYQGETPLFAASEGTIAHNTGQNGTANGALQLTADATTGRAGAIRTYATDLDTTKWDGGQEENVQDYLELWVYMVDPAAVSRLTVSLDCNRASTTPFTDYFYIDFRWTGGVPADDANSASSTDYLDRTYEVEGRSREILREGRREDGGRRGNAVFPNPAMSAGVWALLRAKRNQFTRAGMTAGQGWDTICRVRVQATMTVGGGAGSVMRVDSLAFVHGQLLGGYSYRYILARDATAYVSLSPVSDPSAEVVFTGQSARVFIPPDSGRDPDATEVWLYRMGQDLNAFYRVATKLLSAGNDVPFAMTAKWEMASIGQDLTLEAGAMNTTCADEDDYAADFILYTRSNHNSADELAWLADCGASLDLATVTGGVVIEDTMSDLAALELDIPMETDNQTPPSDIVGIAGPYYDRLFCLTATTLWPSRVLNPESYGLGQAITVGNSEETAYWVVQALGGLYVGTSRDIYRIDGTFAELPDGTLEAQKTPLNIDHPPVGPAVAKDGPVMVYLAHDGWRAMTGQSSTLLVGPTSLLYRGYTRHGVSPVNHETGRVRVTVSQGQLVAITPEGTAAASSAVLYRYALGLQRWYRHTYPTLWRSIAHEPDGTLIAGDTTGQVWTLDTGTLDDDHLIPVTVWTRHEDDGKSFSPKTAADLQFSLDTGGESLAVALHRDTASIAGLSGTVSSSGRGSDNLDVSALDQWRQLQLRLTGAFSTFYLNGFALTALTVPTGVTTWDSGPLDLGRRDLIWIRHVVIKARAAAPLTVQCYFDGIAWPAVEATRQGPSWNTPTIHDATLGRGHQGAYKGYVPRIVVTSTAPFFPYFVELIQRSTSAETDKKPLRFSAQMGGETVA